VSTEAHREEGTSSTQPLATRIVIDRDGAFTCLHDETVLKAALRAGYSAPYECASGTCGSCKARLIGGSVRQRWPGATGLSDRDRARGDRILCCQAIPTSDCIIQLRVERDNGEPPPRRILGELCELETIGRKVRRIRVHCDADVDFLAGQFMLFEFPARVGFRAYSMANEPCGSPELEFIIRAKPEGAASKHVFNEVRLGNVIALEGPYGRGYLRSESARPIIAVAGGSGLGPMLSVARAALRRGKRSVHLFFGVEDEAEIFARQELSELVAEHSTFRLTIAVRQAEHSTTAHSVGAVGDVMLTQRPDVAECDLYMAGPPAMIDDLLIKAVREGKVQATRVFFDRF
jgi:NAD(P)H-flavin reductase/ferredoxin